MSLGAVPPAGSRGIPLVRGLQKWRQKVVALNESNAHFCWCMGNGHESI